jgi:hypothetical protein
MIPSRPYALERVPDPYQALLGLGKFDLLTAMLCSQSVAPELLGFTHDDEALLRLFLQTRSVSHGLNSELFEQGRYPSGGKVLLDHGLGRLRRPQREEVQVWCRHRLSIVDMRMYSSALLVAYVECLLERNAEMASNPAPSTAANVQFSCAGDRSPLASWLSSSFCFTIGSKS